MKAQFLTDVFIERWDGKAQANSALLAGEIEASPNHSVAYVYEGQSYSDYLHDFSKLMYVAAPKRLFVACIDVGRMDDLKTTISRGFRAMRTRDSATTVTTATLLLPSATRQRESVSLGVGLEDTELEWSTV